MSDEGLAELVLAGATAYGPLILGLTFLISASGLPFPSTPLMMAAGALVQRGLVNGPAVVLFGLVGVVTGDSCSYAIGRFAGDRVERSAGRWRKALFDRARAEFARHGAWAIFTTRFLLTSLDVPTGLVAGTSRYEYRRFLFYAAIGRGVWLLLYGAIGFIVGDQWERASQLVRRYGLWLSLVVLVALAFSYLLRRRRQTAS